MDKRRRQYVPLFTGFAVEGTGQKLLGKFGKDGLITWVCVLAAAKRSRDQGTFNYVSEDGGWHELGLGYPHTPTGFTLDEFFTFTGQLKKTRKRRVGQLSHVEITGWGEWNKAWDREVEADRKSSKRAQNTPDNVPPIPGRNTDETPTEVEVESEGEPEGFNTYTPIVDTWLRNAPPLTHHRGSVIRSKPYKLAIVRALRFYPEAEIVTAISNYATVLASPGHYFTHRWSLKDFLARGLDAFVAEADPLTNFAKRAPDGRDRGMTFAQILGMNGGTDEPRALPFRSVA